VLLVAASAISWGSETLPILPRPMEIGVPQPWSVLLVLGGCLAIVAGILLAMRRRRAVLVAAAASFAFGGSALAGGTLYLVRSFDGVDSTLWSRYAPPGSPPANHGYGAGFFIAILGLATLAALFVVRMHEGRVASSKASTTLDSPGRAEHRSNQWR